MTVEIDLLVTREGLAPFEENFLGRGYVERFAGSKGMRGSGNGLPIDVLLASFAEELDPSVREKFAELWRAAQAVDPDCEP